MLNTMPQAIINLRHQTTFTAPQNTLVSYSVPWPNVSLLDFLRHAANAPRLYWESSKLPLGFAGSGAAAMLTANGPNRFQTIRRAANRLFENIIQLNGDAPPGIGPRLFGGFAFWPEHTPHGLWRAFPAARFLLPRYQLTRLPNQMWLTVNHRLEPAQDPLGITWLLQEELQQLRHALTNQPAGNESTYRNPPEQPPQIDELVQPESWNRLVTDATGRIRRNELDKVVLARARKMGFPRAINPAEVLTRLADRYPDCYRFLFEPVPGHAFYGATPELLAEVTGTTLRTVALAGSIRRGSTAQEDDTLGQQLLATPKERIEHAHVVEAIEEGLQPLVTNLHIAAQPGLCKLSNIQHIQTTIQAQLAHHGDILPVVEALHPTPALGGRPRHLALDIIKQVEPIARGWYGAPIGWLDPQRNGIFAVAIRSAVSVESQSMLFAGAGIVADSQPEKEWRETQLKFRPLMEALNGASLDERAKP